MCLGKVRTVKPIRVSGYVVRQKIGDSYYGVFNGNSPQQLNRWMKASDYGKCSHIGYYAGGIDNKEPYGYYEAGWHILRTKKEAFRFINEYIKKYDSKPSTHFEVMKVQVSGYITSGPQEATDFDVSVYRRIKLVKEVKE
jgi:hypothetical protein